MTYSIFIAILPLSFCHIDNLCKVFRNQETWVKVSTRVGESLETPGAAGISSNFAMGVSH